MLVPQCLSSPFFLSLVSFALDLNNFAVVLFCYLSNQWGIYDTTVSSGCKGFHFIGLFAQKIGTSGSGCSDEDYDVDEIGCRSLEISGTETCDDFKQARLAASFALAFVSALLVFAVVNLHLARKANHNKCLWLSLLVCFVGNCSTVVLAFVTYTSFKQSIIDDGLEMYPYDFKEGDAMNLMIYVGTTSICSAIVTAYVLSRGGLCCKKNNEDDVKTDTQSSTL
jgi:hypothetical protein